jgi:hypothetical protein
MNGSAAINGIPRWTNYWIWSNTRRLTRLEMLKPSKHALSLGLCSLLFGDKLDEIFNLFEPLDKFHRILGILGY